VKYLAKASTVWMRGFLDWPYLIFIRVASGTPDRSEMVNSCACVALSRSFFMDSNIMARVIPDPVICVNSLLPHMVGALGDYCFMDKPSRTRLAENVKKLAVKQFGDKFQGRLIAAGIAPGNVTRILKGNTSVGLDVLDAIAKVFKVSPCHLLTANFDVEDPPVCMPKSAAEHAKAGQIMEEAIRKLQESSAR